MDGILLTLIVLLLVATLGILYLNLRSNPKDENKENEEIANLNAEIVKLKDSVNATINTSLGSMSTSFTALSTGVTKDMTEALTKVDEKVGNFNNQVELLNKSQEGITKILAGVKKYGVLAEFSLNGRGVSYGSIKQSRAIADQVLYGKLRKAKIFERLLD